MIGGLAGAGVTPGLAVTVVAGRGGTGGAAGTIRPDFVVTMGGKSAFVFDAEGDPVTGGAAGLAAWEREPEGGRIEFGFGIGVVMAVDHVGMPVVVWEGGVGTRPWRGSVVAAEILGLGVIFVEAGFKGRGGRLIRNVSRLGAFGSRGGTVESAAWMCNVCLGGVGSGLEGGTLGSAIKIFLYLFMGNVQWRS